MEHREVAEKLRQVAIDLNLIGDDIFKLETLSGEQYAEYLKTVGIIERQSKRILNFAWKKVTE